MLISFKVTAKLICPFVFAYAKSRFSHDAAQIPKDADRMPNNKDRIDLFEPRCEKTGLRGFRPGPTLTGLYNHRRWLEAGNFAFRK